MLHKGLGGASGIALTAAIGFVLAALQSQGQDGRTIWLWVGFVVFTAVGILGGIGWMLTDSRSQNGNGTRNAHADRGGIANTGKAALVAQTSGQRGDNINIATVNVHPPFEDGSQQQAVPVLEFSDPVPDDNVWIVDAQFNPHTSVRMWRVELRNMVEETEAADVEVVIARSIPSLSTFPVDLHRFHDDNAPFAQRHNVRHNAPITFDVIAKDHHEDVFYLWRSDLPRPQYTFIYQLSAAERTTLLSGIRGEGPILILRAAGKAPLRTKEKAYRIFIDPSGQLMMETVQPDL